MKKSLFQLALKTIFWMIQGTRKYRLKKLVKSYFLASLFKCWRLLKFWLASHLRQPISLPKRQNIIWRFFFWKYLLFLWLIISCWNVAIFRCKFWKNTEKYKVWCMSYSYQCLPVWLKPWEWPLEANLGNIYALKNMTTSLWKYTSCFWEVHRIVISP